MKTAFAPDSNHSGSFILFSKAAVKITQSSRAAQACSKTLPINKLLTVCVRSTSVPSLTPCERPCNRSSRLALSLCRTPDFSKKDAAQQTRVKWKLLGYKRGVSQHRLKDEDREKKEKKRSTQRSCPLRAPADDITALPTSIKA